MVSPVTAGSSACFADSCIGSLLSIVSKSEMRYEGVLYYINPHDATIGLKKVRPFGTEGRRKDGPQVPPDDRVFEYIQFRGSDIKDLQVFQSSAPQNTSPVLDDPAIIQTHYLPPALTSKSALYASSESMANLTSIGGLQNLAVKDSIPLFLPVRNLDSTGTLLTPPSGRMNMSAMLPHVQGLGGPLTGIPFVEQQSLVGSAPGLTAVYNMKQQMQYPAFNSLIPSSTSSPHEPFRSLMLPVTLGSQISVPNSTSLPAFPSSPPLNSLLSPNVLSDSKHSILPTIMPSSTVPSLSPLTPKVLERSSNIAQAIDKPNLALASNFQNLASADGALTSCNPGELKSSRVVPGQCSPTGPANCPSSQPSESVREDVEVVKVLISESCPIFSKDAKAPNLLLPTAFSRKDKDMKMFDSSKKPHLWGRGDMKRGANAPSYKYVSSNSRKVGRKIDANSTRAHQISKGSSKERVVKKDGTDLKSQGIVKGRSMEGGKKMNGTVLWIAIDKKGKPCAQERGKKLREALCTDSGGTKGGRRRVATEITHSIKFTEDFDFEAMNEKFNKDEIWGDLGKRRDQLKGKGNAGESDAAKSDLAEAVMSLDIKHVYVKDEFFDSLSRDQPGGKLSEWRKIDKETFGNFKIARENHGAQRMCRGSQFKGSDDGRRYGNAGRGRGRGKVPV